MEMKQMSADADHREIAKGLRCYTVEELQNGLAFQRERYDWDFSKEREFI